MFPSSPALWAVRCPG